MWKYMFRAYHFSCKFLSIVFFICCVCLPVWSADHKKHVTTSKTNFSLEQTVLQQFIEGLPAGTVAWVPWDQAQPEDGWVGQPERGPVSAPRRSLQVASPPWPAAVGQGSRLSINPTIAPRLPAAADTGPLSLGAAWVPEQMCWRCRWLGHFHQNCPVLIIYSTEDFPQEQSHDHQMVCPDPTLSLPHFLMTGYIEWVIGCRKSTPSCRYRK